MKINKSYHILKRDNEFFITNIENGDVYLINDVTLCIFEKCDSVNTVDELTELIYKMFQNSNETYSKQDLKAFILELISNNFILIT